MAETSVNNGVNVDALLAAREVLKGAPQAAKFTWRASCKWQNGTHSLSKVEELRGNRADRAGGGFRRWSSHPRDHTCVSEAAASAQAGRVGAKGFQASRPMTVVCRNDDASSAKNAGRGVVV